MSELWWLITDACWELWRYSWILLIGLGVPVAWLAFARSTYPAPRLVKLSGIAFVMSLIAPWYPEFLPVVVAFDLAWLTFAALDLRSLPRAADFRVARTSGRIVSLQKPHPVTLTVDYLGLRPQTVLVRDDVPAEFHSDQPGSPVFTLSLPPRHAATIEYQLKASRRGEFKLRQVYLRSTSARMLWRRDVVVPCPSVLQVYPDLDQLHRYAALGRTNRLSLIGVRRARRIGQDHEFERLRDYTTDDNFRHIDWRATARRSKLTVKDFQTSQSQRVVFLIDTGRMMGSRTSGLTLLDHALNAALMLSYVALRQGDSVGMMHFADAVQGYVAPRGGMSQMNRLLHASFDRFPRLVESRYDLAFLHLAQRCRRRALVILITNVLDEVNARQIEQYLSSVAGRHVAMGVLLRDHSVFDAYSASAVDSPRLTGAALYRAAAAADILAWRHQVLVEMQHKGVRTIDVFPEDLTSPLINRYLEIKARHLL